MIEKQSIFISLCLIVLLSASMSFSVNHAWAISNSELEFYKDIIEINNDFIVKEVVVWENSNIVVNGSIFIYPNGSLIIRNCEVKIIESYNGEHWIEVSESGSLIIINSKLYSYNPYYHFNSFMRVNAGARLVIRSSEISGMGIRRSTLDKSGIYINTNNVSISESYFHDNNVGLIIINATSIDIIDNTFHDCGIYIINGSDISIDNNTFIHGVVEAYLNESAIRNNYFSNSSLLLSGANTYLASNYFDESALRIFSARNFTVSENVFIFDNYEWWGLTIGFSNSISVNDSRIYGSRGVNIHDSRNITLFNNILAKTNRGLFIENSSSIIAMYNVFLRNQIGLCLDEYTSQSTFIMNDLVGNTISAIDKGSNQFSNESIGNYWSDYNGSDANNDGIGDSPYYVDNDSIDERPLMTPIRYENISPTLISMDRKPIAPLEGQEVLIKVSAIDNSEILFVILSYYDGHEWINVTMSYDAKQDLFTAKIPAFPAGTSIRYKVYICDIYLNWYVSEPDSYVVKKKPITEIMAIVTLISILLALVIVGIFALRKHLEKQ